VKYTLKNGVVDILSKEVKNDFGEAIGINFISSKDLNIFIKHLELCDDNDYFEKGLEDAIRIDSLNLKVIDISKNNCVEINFKEDLENANKLI
jgi:choline kinase